MAAHVWGRIPGPVEPIVLLHGGGGLAGILQYLMLSRQGIHARKWMVLWIVGLVANLLPTALLFISLDKLGVSISWPAEAFLNGFMVAGVAASISGKALFAALAEASPEEAASEGAV
jgi:pimeloyl-ACP methyl ester carboxylesterase